MPVKRINTFEDLLCTDELKGYYDMKKNGSSMERLTLNIVTFIINIQIRKHKIKKWFKKLGRKVFAR